MKADFYRKLFGLVLFGTCPSQRFITDLCFFSTNILLLFFEKSLPVVRICFYMVIRTPFYRKFSMSFSSSGIYLFFLFLCFVVIRILGSSFHLCSLHDTSFLLYWKYILLYFSCEFWNKWHSIDNANLELCMHKLFA